MKKLLIRILISALLPVVATLLLFSCSGEKAGLTVGVLPDVDSIPLLVAQKQGFFREAGVDVKIERFSSPVNRDTAFQSGNIDGAVSDILAAILAINGGFDVRITSMTNGSYKLIASRDSGIREFRDLKGKDVAMSLNTVIEYCTDRMADSAGLGEKDYRKTVIPQIPVRLEMLKAGKVAAATLPEPLASAALSGGSGAILVESSDNLGINPGVMLFSASSVKKKEKEIKAFYSAYNRAVAYLGKCDVGELEDFLAAEAGFPESIKGVISLPDYKPATLPEESEYEGVSEWLEKRGMVSKEIPFNRAVSRGLF